MGFHINVHKVRLSHSFQVALFGCSYSHVKRFMHFPLCSMASLREKKVLLRPLNFGKSLFLQLVSRQVVLREKCILKHGFSVLLNFLHLLFLR